MKHKPICKMGSDRMLPSFAYHKPFMVKFPEKCGYQNRFNPDNKGVVVWFVARYRTKNSTDAVYRWGFRRGHSYNLGLQTVEFQDEIYAIKVCIMETIEKGYICRNIHILSDSHAAIKVLKSFQMKFQITEGLPSVWGDTART
jgi:hypothetical protein